MPRRKAHSRCSKKPPANGFTSTGSSYGYRLTPKSLSLRHRLAIVVHIVSHEPSISASSSVAPPVTFLDLLMAPPSAGRCQRIGPC
jgi:hypothetical protein